MPMAWGLQFFVVAIIRVLVGPADAIAGIGADRDLTQPVAAISNIAAHVHANNLTFAFEHLCNNGAFSARHFVERPPCGFCFSALLLQTRGCKKWHHGLKGS